MSDCTYTITTLDSLILLTDQGHGKSITNAAEDVVAELYIIFGRQLNDKRVIYRDTAGRWDGLAQRHGLFLDFVMLDAPDQQQAIAAALAYAEWPAEVQPLPDSEHDA